MLTVETEARSGRGNRSTNSSLVLSEDYETAREIGGVVAPEKPADPFDQGLSSRLTKPNDQDSRVTTRGKTSDIGERQILGNQKAVLISGCVPDGLIGFSRQPLSRYGIYVVTNVRENVDEGRGEHLVELDLHATSGMG
jgi:hypothetical protein